VGQLKKIILLDGGMSLELLNRSTNKAPRHWSAEYLMSDPDLVADVHYDYIMAGAKIITVNTYSATYTRMAMVDATDKVEFLQKTACELAHRARTRAGSQGAAVAIAGSLPPLNGTYRPDRVRDFDVNLDEYRKLATLQAPYVDLFICETMSTAQEARAAAQAAAEFGKPVWVGWTLDDERFTLRSGETIAQGIKAIEDLGVSAVLANCTPPETISKAMKELLASGLPAGGYANGFTSIPLAYVPGKTKEQLSTRQDLGPDRYSVFVQDWVNAGAGIVGGCCEVGPVHIAKMRDDLTRNGYTIAGLEALGVKS
jgi:S-methylmethionine-dependent homocysteine/selenocysteine methylase